MKASILSSIAAIAALASVSSSAFANGFWNCSYYKTAGVVQVDQSGFEKRISDLRKRCDDLRTRHEAAEMIWDNSSRAYACKVGFFCDSSNNL